MHSIRKSESHELLKLNKHVKPHKEIKDYILIAPYNLCFQWVHVYHEYSLKLCQLQ